MSMRRRYSVSLGGRVVSAAVQTGVLAALARSLGVEHFGTLAVVISLVQLTFTVLELGLNTRVLRVAVEEDGRALMGSLLAVRGVTTVGVLATCGWIAGTSGGPFDLLIIASAVYVTGETLGDLSTAIFQGELKSGAAVAILLARRAAALAPFAFGLSEATAVASLLAAGIVGHAAFWPVVARRAGRPMGPMRILRVSGPLTVVTGAFGVQQTDSAVVAAASGSVLTSSYAAASRLSNPVNLAISTLMQVFIPELSRMEPYQRLRSLRRARRRIFVLALAVACCSFLAPLIVHVLYGDEFEATAPILAGVFVGAGISAVSQIHLAWLFVDGLSLRASLLILGAVVGGLAALGVLALLLGSTGCAIGYVVLQIFIFVAIYLVFRRSVANTDADLTLPAAGDVSAPA